MSIIVIAPEFGIALALDEHRQAKGLCRILGEQWSMTQAFYANMGGLVLRRRISPQKPKALINEVHESSHAYKSQGSDEVHHQQSSIHASPYGPKVEPASLAMEPFDVQEPSSSNSFQEAPDQLFGFDCLSEGKSCTIIFLISFRRCSEPQHRI